jgi:acylphosphatase
VRQAERQGVAGWVRNLPDGRVEAVFEGQSEHVEKAVAWCRKGPAFAHVDDVQVDWEQGEAKYSEFRVHH